MFSKFVVYRTAVWETSLNVKNDNVQGENKGAAPFSACGTSATGPWTVDDMVFGYQNESCQRRNRGAIGQP